MKIKNLYLYNYYNNINIKKYYNILPNMINNIIYIYNGKEYIPIFIKKKMIFYKFGEFIFTKKIYKKYNKDYKFINYNII
uniref:ribosomal protein S19 n=1 Tax=Balanophora yakushimensis TaxID=1128105 RepID=UPI00200176A2|nr:ribosomal protein S19 [Balanophora yakushimensis]UNQ87789.1 ribosomal protein S19 [Balanophora yakushimensis]